MKNENFQKSKLSEKLEVGTIGILEVDKTEQWNFELKPAGPLETKEIKRKMKKIDHWNSEAVKQELSSWKVSIRTSRTTGTFASRQFSPLSVF
jgi:hypothetical protein